MKIQNKNNKKEKIIISKSLSEYKLEGKIDTTLAEKIKNGTHTLTKCPVSIKIINKYYLLKPRDISNLNNQIKISLNLSHPNILRHYKCIEDDLFYFIIMERPKKGNLFDYICKKGRLTLDEASFFYYQLVNAVTYLHNKKIVHRNLKPENIILSENMIIKVADFSLSRIYTSNNVKLSTICGSICYAPPEILKGQKYKPEPIDVWGIGIILYCMLCGSLPFEADNKNNLIIKITNCEYNCPYFVNSNVRLLFKKIFTQYPNERISIEGLKKNFLYNMGKANFFKKFKIFDNFGNLLPQVETFIKNKVIKYIKKELEINNNDTNIEKSIEYKILFSNTIENTNWNFFHIPKIDEQNSKKIYIKNDNNEKIFNKNKFDEVKNNEYNNSGDILFMPPHASLGEAINKNLYKFPEKNDLLKDDIEAIRKIGILGHSFDKHSRNRNYFNEDINYPEKRIVSSYNYEGYNRNKFRKKFFIFVDSNSKSSNKNKIFKTQY